MQRSRRPGTLRRQGRRREDCTVSAATAVSQSVRAVQADDFMPYAIDRASYLVGYFSTRPALKGFVRILR